MQVILYNCSADEETLDKSAYMTQVEAVTAEIKGACDIENPSLILNYNGISFNYMYIPDWGRYYYINSIVVTTGARTVVTATSDVLMSFKSEILGLSGVVSNTVNGFPQTQFDANISLNSRNFEIIKQFSSGGFPVNIDQSACYLVAVKE